jgi:raffinose/stachyose/melibiose transport system permease protein
VTAVTPPPHPRTRRRRPLDKPEIARKTILILFAIVSVGIPMWLVVINSFKPLGEANQLGLGLPHEWQGIENYATVFDQGNIPIGLRNTVLIAIPTVTIVLLVGGMAAWAFARARSRTASLFYYLCITGVLIPPAIVASVQVLRFIGVQGTPLGLILFYSGAWMAFCVFLTTGFVKTIPVELEEAARLDGAGSLTIFRKIIFPLMLPINIAAGFILILIVWNDLLYAFFMLNGNENRTLILGLFNVVSGYQYQIRWNLVFADVIIVSIPLAVAFLLAQRRIVGGLLGAGTDK